MVPAILAIIFAPMVQMIHPQIAEKNCLVNLGIGQPSRHDESHRSVDKRLTDGGRPLVVPARQQAVDKVVVNIFSRRMRGTESSRVGVPMKGHRWIYQRAPQLEAGRLKKTPGWSWPTVGKDPSVPKKSVGRATIRAWTLASEDDELEQAGG
jgi:hypothetical protein